MKFIYFLTATLLFVTSTELFSQTKFIAHRSHSGSSNTFTLAHPGNLGEYWEEEPPPIDTTSRIDTVHAVPGEPQRKPIHLHVLDTVRVNVPVVDTIRVIAPEVPDSVKLQAPSVDALKPSISNKNLREGSSPVSYNSSSSTTTEGNQNGLIWLALGLGLPAIAVAIYNLRRGRESDHV